MTIRSNTNAATISNANDRASATACPRLLGGKELGSASTTPKSEIAFIDPGIDDLQTLLKGIRPDVEPILLSRDEPAMRQIAGALKGRGPLKAIHVIAHGKPGEISFSSGSCRLKHSPPSSMSLPSSEQLLRMENFAGGFAKLGQRSIGPTPNASSNTFVGPAVRNARDSLACAKQPRPLQLPAIKEIESVMCGPF